jgi:general secretion pathway protein A
MTPETRTRTKIQDFRSRFGLHTTPFTREIAVQDRMRLPFFDEALDSIAAVLEERMSAALIAPAGTGKTSLLRTLRTERLPEARYRVHYVKVTDLSKRDMCAEIAFAVGAAPAGSFPTLVRRLQERFQAMSDTDGLRPVLILDDAHDLRVHVLSLLRILTNFDMDSRLVLSVVLSGQPPLARLLRMDALEDVARRIAHYATLRPLSRTETRDYVCHRSTVAGATQTPFDDKALEALYEIGRGNLRATDHLALKTLEVAHHHEAEVADPTHVVAARKLLWP